MTPSRNDASQRSVDTVSAAKLSATQISLISNNKTATLQLIEKIHTHMEKLDKHIVSRERMDEERYRQLEKKMRKLCKRYSRVTKESTDVRKQAYDSLSCLKEGSVTEFKERDIEVHHVSLPEKPTEM